MSSLFPLISTGSDVYPSQLGDEFGEVTPRVTLHLFQPSSGLGPGMRAPRGSHTANTSYITPLHLLGDRQTDKTGDNPDEEISEVTDQR